LLLEIPALYRRAIGLMRVLASFRLPQLNLIAGGIRLCDAVT
jgi:hypothetical protein